MLFPVVVDVAGLWWPDRPDLWTALCHPDSTQSSPRRHSFCGSRSSCRGVSLLHRRLLRLVPRWGSRCCTQCTCSLLLRLQYFTFSCPNCSINCWCCQSTAEHTLSAVRLHFDYNCPISRIKPIQLHSSSCTQQDIWRFSEFSEILHILVKFKEYFKQSYAFQLLWSCIGRFLLHGGPLKSGYSATNPIHEILKMLLEPNKYHKLLESGSDTSW